MKKEHLQNQPNQNQPNQKQGGDAMIYFVTFVTKVDSQTAREVIRELRERFPSKTPVFTPRIPRGRRMVLNINDLQVIVTFPYTLKNPNTQEQNPQNTQEGFTLRELIKNKKS